MSYLKKFRKYGIAYVYSEVLVEENEKYLIPFDGNGMPMEYQDLKEISENLNLFLKKVKKEDYETFYNRKIEENLKRISEDSECFRLKRLKEKKEQEKNMWKILITIFLNLYYKKKR